MKNTVTIAQPATREEPAYDYLEEKIRALIAEAEIVRCAALYGNVSDWEWEALECGAGALLTLADDIAERLYEIKTQCLDKRPGRGSCGPR